MNKILLTTLVSFAFLTTVAEFQEIENSVRRANFEKFNEIIKSKKLNKDNLERLHVLNERTIEYFRNKLHAAKSLFTFSRRQNILWLKSFACLVVSLGAGSVASLFLLSDYRLKEVEALLTGVCAGTSVASAVGALIYLIKVFRYPDKLQKQYNQSLEIEQSLLTKISEFKS